MKKYDLLRSNDDIIRVLEVQEDRILVIDCIKRTMPVWVEMVALEAYSECTSSELSEATGVITADVDALDADQRKIMYERYTMMAPVLSFLADDRMRSQLICFVAEEHGVSKQTVRNHLCLYLAYIDVDALAPKRREDDRALTQDEKNIRWALNKFFYTTKKHSLMTAYTMMLKEKCCNALGVLAEEYPSILPSSPPLTNGKSMNWTPCASLRMARMWFSLVRPAWARPTWPPLWALWPPSIGSPLTT